MSKVMFRYESGFEITKDDLMETVLNGFVSNFGFKPSKSIVKIKYCYSKHKVYSDGFVDEGFICVFFIVPGDGRCLSYHYDSLDYSIVRT